MYFSKVQLLPGKELMGLLKREKKDLCYSLHQFLWLLFPGRPDERRKYIFRLESFQNFPIFYVVSREQPVESHIFKVETKPYEPKLAKGQKLYFSLRANPVVAKKMEGRKNSVRHDICMDAKREGFKRNMEKDEINLFIEKKTKEWLTHKAESLGFFIDDCSFVADNYFQHRTYKKGQKDPISYSTIDYTGLLEVSNVDLFRKTLFDGVGRSKAFGCGLMLIRRAV